MGTLTIEGVVIEILSVVSGQSKSGKDWKKQEFVIETQDQYPKKVAFTLFGEKINMISTIQLGVKVDVSFNVESKEFNGRWFANINAWKIELVKQNNEDIPPEPSQDTSGEMPF